MAYNTENLVKLGQLKSLAQKTAAEIAAAKASIPTKVSQLTNDSSFQTSEQVAAAIQTAIAQSGHAVFTKVDAVPAAADAQENTLYLVMNADTGHYDIYAKVGNAMELLDDTTVDLTNYVEKETGKGLSTNDYTTAEKEKLAGIAEGANKYVHPAHTAAASGLYKVTVDALGHVTAVVTVAKADITTLGIPAQDTTYTPATAEANGLMSKEDKAKLDGITIASDTEVTEMLDEVFPADA
ncbi:MAG: hypothetical protein Q4C28_12670 [Escherichia coli]|nr:hypothetical protein [Escherichia coli]